MNNFVLLVETPRLNETFVEVTRSISFGTCPEDVCPPVDKIHPGRTVPPEVLDRSGSPHRLPLRSP